MKLNSCGCGHYEDKFTLLVAWIRTIIEILQRFPGVEWYAELQKDNAKSSLWLHTYAMGE